MSKHRRHHSAPHQKGHSHAPKHGHRHANAVRKKRAASQDQVEAAIEDWLEETADETAVTDLPISPVGVVAEVDARGGWYEAHRRTGGIHGAIDFVAPGERNVPVVAAMGGEVLFAGTYDGDSGYTIFIAGDDQRIYSYAHLRNGSKKVNVGEYVEQGAPIATMGRTGNADAKGDMVHYVVRERVQPEPYTLLASLTDTPAPPRALNLDRDYKRVPPMGDGSEHYAAMHFAPGQPMETPPPQLFALNVPLPKAPLALPPVVLNKPLSLDVKIPTFGAELPNYSFPLPDLKFEDLRSIIGDAGHVFDNKPLPPITTPKVELPPNVKLDTLGKF